MSRNGLLKWVFLTVFCFGTLSCKKTFDIAIEDALEASQAYQNVFDADAAVLGIYGKLQGIAGQYMVLNELRADLEDVTPASDKYLREINEHTVSATNPWGNPKAYYEIILNCNDVMKNFDVMLANKRLIQADYNIRYSDVATVRSWLYLQLGIHFGSVPYVTDALESIQDVQDDAKFPKLTFDQLLDKLIITMEALPFKAFTGFPVGGNSLATTIDTYGTDKMFIDKNMVLGDLHLWKGNYSQAAKYYKAILEYGEILSSTAATDWYGINTLGGNGGTPPIGGNWDDSFTNGFSERYQRYANIWMLPFDNKFSPSNPFIPLFGEYKIKASDRAIKNWADQTTSNNAPGDPNRGNGKSYVKSGNINYILKLVPNFNSSNPFAITGKWILFKSGELHLRYAETANRDNRDKLAYALLNRGISLTFRPIPLPLNVTNIMQSDTDPASVYYFDARTGDNPRFRQKWSYNQGVRGSSGLQVVTVDSAQYFDMSIRGSQNKPVTNRPGLTIAMEDLIVNEQALESAFEGHRWPTLLRIALRREKETPGSGKAFLAGKVSAKFTLAGQAVPVGVSKLGADVNNWYLPFKF